MEHRRVYALDVLKLFLAYVVAYFHGSMEFRPGPTLAVQIFFMISGFFLARKFYDRSFADHGAAYSAWNYTVTMCGACTPTICSPAAFCFST